MIASLMLALREGLEAALIVAVIAAALRRAGSSHLLRQVRAGVGVAVLASLVVGGILAAVGVVFEGRSEELFEGAVMILAAGVLTWAIFWMQQHAGEHARRVEDDARSLSHARTGWGIFALVFVAVVREGIETALFLLAASFSSGAASVVLGGVIGIAAAVVLGWLLYSGSLRLNVRLFFRATSIVLVVVAGGLLAHGIHELQEAAALPIIIEHVWDLNPVLDEQSVGGQLLKAMFGYNGNPSLIETIGFIAYLLIVPLALWRRSARRTYRSVPAHETG